MIDSSPQKNSLNSSFEVKNSSARKGSLIIIEEGDKNVANEEIPAYELMVTRNLTEDFLETRASAGEAIEDYFE